MNETHTPTPSPMGWVPGSATVGRGSSNKKEDTITMYRYLPLTPVLLSLMKRNAFPIVSTFHVPTPYGDFKNAGEALISWLTITHLVQEIQQEVWGKFNLASWERRVHLTLLVVIQAWRGGQLRGSLWSALTIVPLERLCIFIAQLKYLHAYVRIYSESTRVSPTAELR